MLDVVAPEAGIPCRSRRRREVSPHAVAFCLPGRPNRTIAIVQVASILPHRSAAPTGRSLVPCAANDVRVAGHRFVSLACFWEGQWVRAAPARRGSGAYAR